MSVSPDEFRELVDAYQRKVFRLVASILGPYRDADVEDLTQDVFLQVYRNWTRFRGESAAGSWIYSIARNRALDARKRARFRLPHVGEELLDAGHAPSGPDAETRLALARCVESLPETYRTLLQLYYWQGASIDEIAEVTGIAAGTVKSYLARARKRVEEQWSGAKQT